MRQKCDAWREEVEKLSPLRDEVAQLHQENARLKQEVVRLCICVYTVKDWKVK